jgi:hypothetical protein
MAELAPLPPAGGGYADVLPARSMTSYQFAIK